MDGGAGSNLISLGADNDMLMFNYADHADSYNSVDGGSGSDTVIFQFKSSQWSNTALQDDVAALKAFFASPESAAGETYSMSLIGLDVTHMESVRVFVDGSEVLI